MAIIDVASIKQNLHHVYTASAYRNLPNIDPLEGSSGWEEMQDFLNFRCLFPHKSEIQVVQP